MRQVQKKNRHTQATEDHIRVIRQVLAHQDAREAIILSERASERLIRLTGMRSQKS
jgi:hypothetical protein